MATRRRQRRRPKAAQWQATCAVRALALALALALGLFLGGLRPLWAWLAGISLAAFAFYGRDKFAARRNSSRIPERVLLGLALVGGTVGAGAAMLLFHHKTRKQPFLLRFLAIAMLQGAVLCAFWIIGR